MKTSCTAAWTTVALAAVVLDVAAAAAAIRGFGPANCVSLSRSSAGTCVVRTSCAGQDISSFDISFECVAETGRQTHSLGAGAQGEEEEYDTDMKCNECLPPVSKAPVVQKSAAKPAAGVSLAAVSVLRKLRNTPEAEKKEEVEPPPKAEWYGPESCVGVWKDAKSGTCVMQTDCDKDTQLEVYEFGLVCVDKDAEMTRHLFGMGSFAHKETFSTLIACDKCLALDEYMDGKKAVSTLTNMVKGMKDDLTSVSGAVVKLKVEVFGAQAPAPATAGAAPTPAAPPAKAKAAKFLLAAKPAAEQAPQPAAQEAAEAEVPEQLPQRPPAAKPEVVAPVAETAPIASNDVVQHVKKKASQISEPAAAVAEPSDVGQILAAAVQGAQARGMAVGTAQDVLDKSGYKVPLQQHHAAPLQAAQVQQQVQQHAVPEPQQSEATPPVQIEYVEDKSSDQSDDEDGGSDDDDDGFR